MLTWLLMTQCIKNLCLIVVQCTLAINEWHEENWNEPHGTQHWAIHLHAQQNVCNRSTLLMWREHTNRTGEWVNEKVIAIKKNCMVKVNLVNANKVCLARVWPLGLHRMRMKCWSLRWYCSSAPRHPPFIHYLLHNRYKYSLQEMFFGCVCPTFSSHNWRYCISKAIVQHGSNTRNDRRKAHQQ